jgi:DNA-binding PadR family transcriptional regulator
MPAELTTNSYAILALLAKLGEGSSYDLEVAARSDLAAIWPLAHTTAYQEPLRLERHGYLASRQQASGRRRRSFHLTPRGWEALRRWRDDPKLPPPSMRDEVWLKAFILGDSEMMEMRAIEVCDLAISAVLAVREAG